MDSGSGSRGCISLLGSLIGLIAGLISIIGFFYPDADSFLGAAEQLWATSALGDVAPGVGTFIESANVWATAFARSNPLTPWWTGLLVCIIGGVGKYIIEWPLLLDIGLPEILILVIPVAVWIWLFYGTVSLVAIGVLVAAYIALTLLLSYGLEEVFE